jgi:hypothetical protein
MSGLAAGLALSDGLKNRVASLDLLVERRFTLGNEISFRIAPGVVEIIAPRTTARHMATDERVVNPQAMICVEALRDCSASGFRLVDRRVVTPARPPWHGARATGR